jgi:Ca2+-binding EF-hand superfamily protein
LAEGGSGDNFDWEYEVIAQLRQWVARERITVEEAFKSFDKDFDGYVSKQDLRWALINVLKLAEEDIYPTKLDRLFRLIDFYKTGAI